MTENSYSVLIVDDEFLVQELFTMAMQNMGLQVCGVAATADEAIELATRHKPSLVLMDMRLQGEKDGVDAAIAIQAAMDTKIVYVTGSREPRTLDRINLGNPTTILFKPVSENQLRRTVEDALRR